MVAEFTSTDFAATLKSTRLRDGLSKSISMWPWNDLNSPVVLGQPIASTQKSTCVWEGSIFQDDRACAATVAAMSASASNAHLKRAPSRTTRQLLRLGMKKFPVVYRSPSAGSRPPPCGRGHALPAACLKARPMPIHPLKKLDRDLP